MHLKCHMMPKLRDMVNTTKQTIGRSRSLPTRSDNNNNNKLLKIIWLLYKPDKRKPCSKSHRLSKEIINQRFNKDSKDKTEVMGVSVYGITSSCSATKEFPEQPATDSSSTRTQIPTIHPENTETYDASTTTMWESGKYTDRFYHLNPCRFYY